MREIMLIVHFIGLAMGIGTAFAHAFLSAVTTKMSAEEVVRFRVHTLVLSKMGNIGLILLLISGFYMITPYWSVIGDLPLLIAKLALVLVLCILIFMINKLGRKALQGNADLYLKKIEPMGKMTLLISLVIVVLAVYVFH